MPQRSATALSQHNATTTVERRVRVAVDSDPVMDEALRRVRQQPRRLDPVSAAWLRGYRELAAVRPNTTGHVLAAEVEQYLTGAAA